ncbi:MAG: hypothetical protein AAF797_16280 [Planctomycetota bacterium]
MSYTLGVMVTCTTYGMWLRGDRRGWVDDGRILPADADLEDRDRGAMKHRPWTFSHAQCLAAGALICESLRERLGMRVWALAVESWHLHAVVDLRHHDIGAVVKCMKDAVRYGLKPGRPIWATKYDKRWCFDTKALRGRIAYVERHNTRHGFAARRWDGVVPCPHLAPGQ